MTPESNYAFIRDQIAAPDHVDYLSIWDRFPAKAFRDETVHMSDDGIRSLAATLLEELAKPAEHVGSNGL